MQNLSFLLLELMSSHLKRSGSVQENGKGEQERIEIGGGGGGVGRITLNACTCVCAVDTKRGKYWLHQVINTIC